MMFVALNENIAAFVPGGINRDADPRAALNKLMTVNSWRLLIDFLKNEGCNGLFAKREAEPLVDRANHDVDGMRGRFSHEGYYFDELAGSLKARIDKDDTVDYLDDLTRADLLAQGDVYELYIPELLSYASDIASLLTLAAVALGAQPPDDLVSDFTFEQVECDFDETFMPCVDEMVDKLFGKHGPIAIMDLNMKYWPETDYGPYMNDAPITKKLFSSALEGFKREREGGVMAYHAYLGPDHNGEDQDYDLFFYDTSRYSREEAIRMLCAMIVVHTAGDTTLTPAFEEDLPFHHAYADEPEPDGYPHFSLDEGFKHPKTNTGFKRWQLAVQEVAEAAIYDGRVTLCPICGTPIITKSDKSRIEYCCESHKTVASKRRRQRAHQLYQMGVSVEEAKAEIGEAYSISVEKWYAEAARYVHSC
ncbi:MAG: hypothetical protein J6D54_04445 [Olsenella sp.]|nr:hypothetical protein [Olsenella sp.]